VSVTAQATATTYTAQVNSFSASAGISEHLLPMAYDVAHWANFMATGQDPDGNTSYDSSGNPEVQVYPSSKYTGNFGELALDNAHAGASTIKGWVDNGLNANGIQTLINDDLIPVSAHDPTKWDWLGNPGFKATTVSEVNKYTGDIFMLPLFKAYDSDPSNYQAGNGNGENYNYNIVGFIAIKIMPVSDSNRQIVVQPANWYDPAVVLSPTTITPGGTSTNTSKLIFIPAKLTQ
jgi:hypothetical protein